MLTDPGRYWERDWNPERLTVRHMDAMQLDFQDDSFDAIFSSSSIEHFGDFPDVRRSVEEMFRVLRPGGILALATEFRLEGDQIGYPGLLRFDEPELRALLLDGLWWDPGDADGASDLGRDARHRGRDERGDRRPAGRQAGLEPLPAPRPPPRAVPLDQRPRRAGQVRPDRGGVAAARARAAAGGLGHREDEAPRLSLGGQGPAQAQSREPPTQAEPDRASRSARTIIATSSSKPTRASQPSSSLALVGSATTSSMSAGRTRSGSIRT